ncbi:DNA circularization N-terminal domain-containing protein [Herbaspirillum sp. DW155]|uniref:DNA circularization protein n=1 Tax=Herbaspirillum sp. DW155 TaxID=3095609 RepID=UPI003090ABFE|nr:DNA circularization N-terminal domain-containing protein [Herbaspirillum sp. DW155]
MSTFSVGTVAGSIGGAASAANQLADTALGLFGDSDGSWLKSLKQASYGGLPFGVISSSAGVGRRVVVHEYPERDEVWVEDLGKRARRFGVIGFLLQNDLVYKGGAVIQQRDRLVDILEKRFDQTNPGLQLVHPTMGTLNNVCCINCDIQEHTEHGGYFEIRFDFIVSGARKYPVSATSTEGQVASAADAVKSASLIDYLANIAAAVKKGAAVVKQAISTAVGWYTQALGLVNDVRRVFKSVSTLAGNLGNLFGGANNGYSGSNAKAANGVTAAQLLAKDTAKRAAVIQAGAVLAGAAASPADGAALSAAASALAQALLATASDPADGVRLLSQLSQYQPSAPTTSSQTGQAMASMQSAVGALMRRTALAELASATSSYQPASSEDAIAVRNQVSSLIENEIQIAGDSGDDETYVALIGLRAAVIDDLNTRGAQLASVTEFSFSTPMNALALAQRLYRDPSRASELISQAAPIHPAFMPQEFRALSE